MNVRPAYPPLPCNIGKIRSWTSIRGEKTTYTIEDEICRQQSTAPHKALYLQRLRSHKDGGVQYRVGYYMIGVKSGRLGKWVWAQYAPLLPRKDLAALIRAARRKGWL
jgi:hypothetical protein